MTTKTLTLPRILKFAGAAVLGSALGIYVGHIHATNVMVHDPQVKEVVVDNGTVDVKKNALLKILPPPVRHGYHTTAQKRYKPEGLAAAYLKSHFAQSNNDWERAHQFLTTNIEADPSNTMLLKRAMILSLGSGQIEDAFRAAHQILEQDPENALALMFLSFEDFNNNDFVQAQAHIDQIHNGSIEKFMRPFLTLWISAAQDNLTYDETNTNVLYRFHTALAADYLNQTDAGKAMLDRILLENEVNIPLVQRIADLYYRFDEKETALKLYQKILAIAPSSSHIQNRIATIQDNKDLNISSIETAASGLARSLYDIAQILYTDYNDNSARLFAHLSLFLDPDLIDNKILLGGIVGESENYEEAIHYYNMIAPESEYYVQSRLQIAQLLEDHNQIADAIGILEELAASRDNVEALIQIGDIFRRQKNFDAAIKSYNEAYALIDKEASNGTANTGSASDQLWKLHYVRGMAYEQNGEWALAERDLVTALEIQPENPYVLNYLGYSWADQGMNLQRSLNMIKKAHAGAPNDGYITDSLGWVLFKLGQYDEAVPHLEQAVALLPYDPVINDHLGDAYWKQNRYREAKFQWSRAKNYAEDNQSLILAVEQKLEDGLHFDPELRHAQSEFDQDIQKSVE